MQLFEISFERILTEVDGKQNIPFKFQVPGGVTHLRVRLEYAPHKVAGFLNMLTLTLFDPSGWRGSGHRHGDRHEVVIGADGASPGYLAGKVLPGVWTVEVDTHMVMPGEPCRMKLSIGGDDEPVRLPAARPFVGRSTRHGPGWYRGDLHAHSQHSDARWDIPGLLAFARARELDFTTLSDHNTTAGLAEIEAAATEDLLTMGGMELTTFWGHALTLGIHGWVDWRTYPGRGMDQVAAEVIAKGGLFIIAHPASPGDPYCTGCDWRYPSLTPGAAQGVEVWNGEWLSEVNNETALSLAYGWLNQGCRIALTAGTDNHLGSPEGKYGFNVVYAQDLSEAEILKAIRAGHLYLSAGPRLDLQARLGERQVMMGDALDVPVGETVGLIAAWSGCATEDRLALVVDGEEREQIRAGSVERFDWQIAGGQAHWCLVTLRDAQGTIRAITNPIYFDGRAWSSPI